MSHIVIKAPIWNGGDRAVGLAEGRLNQQDTTTTFEITYTRGDGDRIYPNRFAVPTAKVMQCRTETKHGMKLRIVPLSICTEVPA